MVKFVDTAKAENLVVIDALNLAFRWKHKGETDFRFDYQKTVESLGNSYKAAKIVLVCDHKGSNFRKEILPEYKQNRKDKYESQTEEEKEEARKFFDEFEQTMINISKQHLLLRYTGVEADDLAAFIVKKYANNFNHVWLISSDKDWDLLITEKSSRFSYVTRKEVTFDNWRNHYDFPVEKYVSVKCLTGDTNDNVPGVNGIGPKRAIDLVNTYGSAFDIYESLPINSKYKHIQALNNSGDLLLKNYMLMDLMAFHEDAIGQDNILDLAQKLDQYIN